MGENMGRQIDKSQTTIPNCAEVDLVWTASGRTFKNILHGTWTGAQSPTSALAETLFTAFKSGFTTSGWAAAVHTDVSFTGVSIKDLRQPNLGFVQSSSAAAPGTGAGTAGPLNTALVVTQRTARSGKGFTGRTYLAGMDATQFATHLTATAGCTTAAAAFLTAVFNAMSTNSIPMGVAQRALLAGTSAAGAAMPPRPAGIVPVTQCAVINARLDSQRKRLGR